MVSTYNVVRERVKRLNYTTITTILIQISLAAGLMVVKAV
jgi:hypothetical protein